jgi:hypothetical protein
MPYLAPLAAMPTNSNAPRFAEINASPVTQAGIDLPEVRKSEELFMYRRKANPIPTTNAT